MGGCGQVERARVGGGARENLAKNASPADNSWHSLDWLHYAYLQLGRTRDALALIETASTILRGVTIPDDNPDARNIVGWLAFRQGLETGKWDAYPGGFPTVDAAMKQPRPTPRALSIATSAAYESAIASLRGQNDTGSGTQSHGDVPCRAGFIACGRTAPCCVAPVVHAARRHDRAS